MYFSKQDEITLRQLLKKAKAQADAHDAAQRAPGQASSASPGLQGGYGGDTASYKMAEAPPEAAPAEAAAAKMQPSEDEHRDAAEPTELAALRRILAKYDVAPRDVDALLAWRHSADF